MPFFRVVCVLSTLVLVAQSLCAQEGGDRDTRSDVSWSGAIARTGSMQLRGAGQMRFQNGGDVASVRYTRDGKSIVVQTNSGAWIDLALWDAVTGRLQNQLEVTRNEDNGTCLGFPFTRYWNVSNWGDYLATCDAVDRKNPSGISNESVIKEIATGKTVFRAKTSEGFYGHLRLSPDAKIVVDQGTLTLIDLEKGGQRKLKPKDKTRLFGEATFSPDGKILLVNSGGGNLDWWDLDRDTTNVRLPQALLFPTRPIFAPNSKSIALVCRDAKGQKSRLIVVDVRSGKTIGEYGEYGDCDDLVSSLLFSPDGKQLAAIARKLEPAGEGKNGAPARIANRQIMRRWEVATGKALSPIETTDGLVAQFTPDGKTLAIGTAHHLHLCEAISGREQLQIPLEMPQNYDWEYPTTAPHDGDYPFAFSPDGKTVAVGAGRAIRLFDVATGKEIGPTP
jgi:WD40 repeat protein